MIPVAVVGLFFKDSVEALFGENLFVVAISLMITALLLFLSDNADRIFHRPARSGEADPKGRRNGISFIQAFAVGLGQACAVAPGLSRSGTTIATGLVCGVKRENMAQFSFLMVLVPILGEQLLNILDMVGADTAAAPSIGVLPLLCGFLSAFVSGLLACKLMVALVKKARLRWFALYCSVVAVLLFIFM